MRSILAANRDYLVQQEEGTIFFADLTEETSPLLPFYCSVVDLFQTG